MVQERKISQLPDLGNVTGQEYFHVAHGGRSYKVTMNELIEKFIDGVDLDAIEKIRQAVADIEAVEGVVTQDQLTQALSEINIPDVSGFVTEEVVNQKITQALQDIQVPTVPGAPDLSNLVTKDEMQQALEGIEHPSVDLSSVVTKDEMQQALDGIEHPTVDLSGYVTKGELQQAVENIEIPAVDLSGHVTTEELERKLEEFPKASDVSQAISQLTQTIAEDKEELIGLSTATIGNILWVGPNGSEQPNGSITNPFPTIQQAIDSTRDTAQQVVILVTPGSASDGDVVFGGKRQSFLIQGFGCNDSHLVQIKGCVTVQGPDATRFCMKDISIQAQGSRPGLVISGTQGRHYFHNVTIEKGAGHTGPLVSIEGNEKRRTVFTQCCVSGEIAVSADVEPTSTVYFNENNGDTHLSVGGQNTVDIRGGRMGSVISNGAGVARSCFFTGNSNGDAIVNQGSGFWSARFVDFQKTDSTYLNNTNVQTTLCIEAQ